MYIIKNILNISFFYIVFLLCNSKLLFVNVHFRHGARGSLFLIDKNGTDLFGEKWAKRGILTPKGKRQVFLNGIKHRERYYNFLNKEYIEDEIKAYSTDSYRAISSLECYLNGLYHSHNLNENIIDDGYTIYPPGNITEHMKNSANELGLNAIPKDNHIIPINIFQKSEHSFVLHEPGKISDCQSITDIRQKIISKDRYKKLSYNFRLKYEKSFNNIFISKDMPVNIDFTPEKINILCDSFYSDLTDNRDLSYLEKEGIKIEELNEYCNNILSIIQKEIVSGNRDIVMMSQTPPIKKLLKLMDERIELDKKGESDKIVGGSPKYTIWSGHDSSISTIQMFMTHIFGTKWFYPIFASTVLFELHKKENNSNDKKEDIYELRYYVNDELLLKINYYIFKNKVNKNLWTQEEIDNFCKFSIVDAKKIDIILKKYKWIILALIVLLLISILLNIRNFFNNKKKQKEN